jgi:hypothetical protein
MITLPSNMNKDGIANNIKIKTTTLRFLIRSLIRPPIIPPSKVKLNTKLLKYEEKLLKLTYNSTNIIPNRNLICYTLLPIEFIR